MATRKKLKSKKTAPQKSAARALAELKKGNSRFVSQNFNDPRDPGTLRDLAQREHLTAGQWPWAVVLSCADSRVPPELIFDCGLGEIFTIRVAGNVANSESIASVEYAVHHLPKPVNLVVVLGHEGCGAVKTAIDIAAAPKPADLGRHLNGLLSYITPAVSQLAPRRIAEFNNKSTSDAKKSGTLTTAVKSNADNSVAELKSQSSIIAGEPGVVVVPAIYRLATGKVDFFET